MKLSNLSYREQALFAGVLLIIIALFYGLLRYKPAVQSLKESHAELISKQNVIKTSKFPDAPPRGEAELQKLLDEANKSLLAIQTELEAIQPSEAGDPQDLQIRISEIARNLGVKIRDRRPYSANDPAANLAALKPLGTSEASKNARRAERALKRRQARLGVLPEAAPANTAKTAEVPVEELQYPPKGGVHDLITRLSAEGKTQRPLQQLIIEADFRSMQRFISELEHLPNQITVVQLHVAVSGKEPVQGMAQSLTATLVISL